MVERITILGGSSVYIPEFIRSLAAQKFHVKEIVLFGKEGKKLPVVANFCARLLRRTGLPAEVVHSTNLHEAVKDAKYVINHVRVGGMAARVRDETLPPKMGMLGDDVLGAGGVANALRTLPVVFGFTEVLEQVNPSALFINLTDPMGAVVEACARHTKLRVAGACDTPALYHRKVADLLNCPPGELRLNYLGVDHLGWIQDIIRNDASCMSRVLDLLERNGRSDSFDMTLVDLFRMIPATKVGLYFHLDEHLKRQRAGARFRGEVLLEAEKQILRLYEDESLNDIPALTRQRNTVWYDTTIVPMLRALEDTETREMVLCVRNDGAIRDFPDDCSVEVPAAVNKDGITPRKAGSCPRFLKGLYFMIKECDRLTVEAVRQRSYEHALQALCVNPFVPSVEAAKRFLDAVIKEEALELH